MGQASSGIEERYFLQKVRLGQGSFGTVWRSVDRRSGAVVAVKQMDKVRMGRQGMRREHVEREVAMMRACPHENVAQLFDTFEDRQSIFLALEYCEGGDFGDKVRERGLGVQEHEAMVWVRHMCSAIAFLHSKRICHRDIKPDNFMVSAGSGACSSTGVLKLADFGLAVFVPAGQLLTEKCGTPAFMAPEQHLLPTRSRGYSFPVDVWAAGVAFYQVMFGGRHPFLSDTGMLQQSRLLKGSLDFSLDGLRPGLQGRLRYSEAGRRLCARMVERDANCRLSAADVMNSPWCNLESQPTLGRRSVTLPAGAGEQLAQDNFSPRSSTPRTGGPSWRAQERATWQAPALRAHSAEFFDRRSYVSEDMDSPLHMSAPPAPATAAPTSWTQCTFDSIFKPPAFITELVQCGGCGLHSADKPMASASDAPAPQPLALPRPTPMAPSKSGPQRTLSAQFGSERSSMHVSAAFGRPPANGSRLASPQGAYQESEVSCRQDAAKAIAKDTLSRVSLSP